jgi:amino acid transporter
MRNAAADAAPRAGLPDNGFLAHISPWTRTPLRAVWATVLLSILPGLLDLASPIAANAIFSLCAIALDTSYIIPIALRRAFRNHPEVHFRPGPFHMPGMLGWLANGTCILWTCFVVVVFSFPNYRPVTKENMNYAAVRAIFWRSCVMRADASPCTADHGWRRRPLRVRYFAHARTSDVRG